MSSGRWSKGQRSSLNTIRWDQNCALKFDNYPSSFCSFCSSIKFGVPKPVTCRKKLRKVKKDVRSANFVLNTHWVPSLMIGTPIEVKRECEQIHNGARQANKFTFGNISQPRRGERVEKGIDEICRCFSTGRNHSTERKVFCGYRFTGICWKRRENLQDS